MANKMMIFSKSIQSNQLLKRRPSKCKRARICKPAMAFVTDLGAGKHPSPLDKTKTQSPNQELTVGFYRIKKYCSYQKLRPFKDHARVEIARAPVTSCQPL